jgi:hypothetical protein
LHAPLAGASAASYSLLTLTEDDHSATPRVLTGHTMPMLIGTEIFGSQFPVVFDRFETLVGKRLWQKRATAIRAEVRGNPYLREWLLQENRLAMVLDRYSAHKQEKSVSPTINIVDSQEYEAVSFVSQSLAMLDSVDSVDSATANSLLGRVKGCFQNPSDLQGLAFEILTATHLQRRGAEVHLPADGTYDWFSINQSLPFEVECKSISNDKGRQVHFRAALDLQHLIKRELKGRSERNDRRTSGARDCSRSTLGCI